ncbi:MAG: response regulator transcription factor [Bacteroidales bacterium]|nr:response regulator transcription factor [Bacteroidales bacterium]
MALKPVTRIICLDDHRNFSDEIRKRFTDASRYEVSVFHNGDDMLRHIPAGKPGSVCSVVIIGLHDTAENRAASEVLVERIKTKDPSAGILLVVSPDKIEEARKELRFNIDGFIPRNSNMVLRVHNAVKKHISEYNLDKYRKRRKISFLVLAAGILIALMILIIARFRFPIYF